VLYSVYLCSGPCVTLILTKGDTGEGVVEEIRDLVGPKDVTLAKEEAPERCGFIQSMSIQSSNSGYESLLLTNYS